MRLQRQLMLRIGALAFGCVTLSFFFLISEIARLWKTIGMEKIAQASARDGAMWSTLTIAIAVLICLAIFLLSAYLTLTKPVKQLRKLIEFSNQLAAGSLSEDLKLEGSGEINDLARALNHVKDRLQHAIVKLRNSYSREKKAREEAENANRLKTEFMRNMSHELRIPLTPIMGFSSIIIGQLNKGRYDKELEMKIRTIRDCADNMLGIISNLGEMSRLENKEVELNVSEFSSAELMKELLNLHHFAADNKSISLKYVYSPDFPTALLLDREVLFHILSNLLAYAISYSPSFSEVILGCETSRHHIVFTIRDSVAGTQAEVIAQMFKKYTEGQADMTDYLTNARLLGLVSAIINAEILKGKLGADTVPGVGSIFRLSLLKSESVPISGTDSSTLHIASNLRAMSESTELEHPRQEEPEWSVPDVPSLDERDGRKIRVLIAEDSSSNLLLVEQILDDANIAHQSVSNGEQCLNALYSGEYDLLLLDIQMPVMDGLTVVRRLRADARFKNFPIVIMSAFGDSEDREKLRQAGVNECLIKPIQIQDLLQVISALV